MSNQISTYDMSWNTISVPCVLICVGVGVVFARKPERWRDRTGQGKTGQDRTRPDGMEWIGRTDGMDGRHRTDGGTGRRHVGVISGRAGESEGIITLTRIQSPKVGSAPK